MINLYLLIGPAKSGKSHFLRQLGDDFCPLLYSEMDLKFKLWTSRFTKFYIDDFVPEEQSYLGKDDFTESLKKINEDGGAVKIKKFSDKEEFIKSDDITIIFAMHEEGLNYLDHYIHANAKKIYME